LNAYYTDGYLLPRLLSDGRVLALIEQIFTVALVEIGKDGPVQRYCYENLGDAIEALGQWDGNGDPPGNWIKQKLPVERMNPNWSRR
jgi:hypothetical protein